MVAETDWLKWLPPLDRSGQSGLGSWYSQAPGWVDYADTPASNALGVPDSEQGIALPQRETLGQYFDVTFPNGQTHRLRQTDVGPHPSTGRNIDISANAARQVYGSPQEFPTDSVFSWKPAAAAAAAPTAAAPTAPPAAPLVAQAGEADPNDWMKWLRPQGGGAQGGGAQVEGQPDPNDWMRWLGPSETQATEAVPQAAAPAVQPSDHFAITRGLMSGMMKENPEAYADFLEGTSYSAPEALQGPMRTGAQKLRDIAKSYSPQDYQRQIDSMWNVKGVGDAFTWAGEALGSAAASSLPSAVLGGVGAAAGALTPIPGGTAAGALLGATAGSYPLNYADVYGDLKKEGMSPEAANKWAAAAAVPITALDVGSMGFLVSRFGGAAEAKREIARSVARRIAIEAIKTGGAEASTETMQQIIQDATTSLATGKEFLTSETAKKAVESGAVGALFGGTMGGVAGVRPRSEAAKPAPPSEESAAKLALPPQGSPGDVVAPPNEKQPAPVTPEAALATQKPPPGVPAAGTAGVSVPPEGGLLFAEQPAAGPLWYSQLARMAQERLPAKGTAEQMLGVLQNAPRVKQAEMEETGLRAYLQSAALRDGTISKDEVLRYIEDNAIQVEEQYTTKTYPGGDVNVVGRGLDVMVPAREAEQSQLMPWENYVAPGPVQKYTEYTLSIPEKPGQLPYIDPHWMDQPNIVGHVQSTTRVDRAGNLDFHIEGLQSSWAQLGRGIGYMTDIEAGRVATLRQRQQQIKTQTDAIRAEQSSIQNELIRGKAGGLMAPARLAELQTRAATLGATLVKLSNEYRAAGKEVDGIRDVLHESPASVDIPRRQRKPPPMPFKTNWVELLAKRMYRWAADNGYSKVSWANPELAISWNTGAQGAPAEMVGAGTRKFLTHLYGTELPRVFKRIAKDYGGVLGATEIETRPGVWTRVEHVTVPEYARTDIQKGMALFEEAPKPRGAAADIRYVEGTQLEQRVGPEFKNAIRGVVGAVNEFAKKFGLDAKMLVQVHSGVEGIVGGQRVRDKYGLMWRRPDGMYEIHLFAGHFKNNIAAFYATAMHEFGHVVVFEKFFALPNSTQQLIMKEFLDWQSANRNAMYGSMLTSKKAPAWMWIQEGSPGFKQRMAAMPTSVQNYHLSDYSGFHEWMADQVSKWAATSQEAVSVVDRAWQGIAKALRFFQEWMAKTFGVETRATLTIQNWLDSFLNTAAPMAEDEYIRQDLRTQKQNQYYVGVDSSDLDVGMPPQQASVAPIMQQVLGGMGGAPMPPSVNVARAHADRINWVYELFGSILDLAQANPTFGPLLRYIEKARNKDREETEIQDRALSIAKDWRGLGRNQEEKLASFIDELTNMTYLSDVEKQRGVTRHPTQAEVMTLARKTGVEQRGLGIAARVRLFTEKMLDLTSDLARIEAMKIVDPIVRANKIDEINAKVRALKAKPYFPFMRFGSYYVTVKNKNGVTIYFETFERRGLVSAERQQQRKYDEMKQVHPDADVTMGKLPKTAEPFHGLPPMMLDLIKEKLSLTPGQLDALNQLKFQLSPALSFQHHFQHKRYVPGYSRDFLRAFSRWAFHAGRYYTKNKFIDGMRQDIRDAQAMGGNKASRIADFLRDHLQNAILDVKGDYGTLKGMMFLWAMGYSPASATLNMTQTPMITFPFLAANFGNVKAMKKIARAMVGLSNFYKRGTYEGMPDWQLRALGYGIKTKRIVETQAPQLAGLGQGGIFHYSSGGNAATRAANQVFEKSSLLFEGAEQWNRRIAFRATMQLAFENPGTKLEREAMMRYPGEYAELTGKWGFSEAEARAIVTAGHAVDRTQFVYAGWARPKFMRGRLSGSIFIFKRYLQSLLFLVGSDRKFLFRYALMASMMGGLGGIPGAEDLKNLVQAMLRWMGYNADVEKQIRTYIKDYTGDAIPGDVVLHGMARRGFGIPAILDALGGIYTGRPGRGLDMTKPGQNIPYPQLDRSRAITPGPIIPEVVWQMMDPSKSIGESIGGAQTQALGYGFSAMANMIKAVADNHLRWTDLKRWEKAEPRAIASLSKMYRALTEEDPGKPGFTRERSGQPRSGTTVVRYDLRDPEQLMEVIAVGMGYNDLRRANEWDRIIHQNEHTKYVDIQRKALLEQYAEAIKSSPQEAEAVRTKIREFNMGLGEMDRGKVIKPETMIQSLKARERERIARERNIPVQRGNIPIAREYERIYPRTIEYQKR